MAPLMIRVAAASVAIAQLGACVSLRGDGAASKFVKDRIPPPPSQDDIFMHYMPSFNLVVCGCGKCGTTSLYEYIYSKAFGHPWNYTWDPYIQDVMSYRWEDKWQHIVNRTHQQALMESAYSFALIRDPKERLVSAWKSKVSCGDGFGSDFNKKDYVRTLRTLGGLPRNESVTCMSLDEFAETLLSIKQRGALWKIDRHFLPQNSGCFDQYGPEKWTKVVTIEETNAFSVLAQRMGAEDREIPHEHGSPSTIFVSRRTAETLNILTKQEYDVLADYLPRTSKVQQGVNVIGMKPEIHLEP